MKKHSDKIIFILALIYFCMALSAYIFVQPISTVILIVGGVLLGILSLYGISLDIAERKNKRIDQQVQTAQAQEQQDDQTQSLAWEGTVKVDETEEDIAFWPAANAV